MSKDAVPWYVRWIVGIGAWVTAIVLVALGGAIVFALLDFEDPLVLAFFGALYLGFGLWLLRQDDSGVFANQLGVATAAAGAALIVGGLAWKADEFWAGFFVAVLVAGGVIAASRDRTLQFLVSSLAICFYIAAIFDSNKRYAFDFVAIATPVGLYLLLRPPRRDLLPTAIALLLAFPLLSVGMMESGAWMRNINAGGTIARIIHIVLFLGLAYLYWLHTTDEKAKLRLLGFAVVSTIVCLVLPLGGSAAMLILMLAFVIGSKPFALLGIALQVQFISRYYYSLEMNLLDKSILLMAVGALLTLTWWLMHRGEAKRGRA